MGYPYVWMPTEYVWTLPYVWMPLYVWMLPVHTQHKESMLCHTKGCPYAPIHLGGPMHVDTPFVCPLVWTPSICLVAPICVALLTTLFSLLQCLDAPICLDTTHVWMPPLFGWPPVCLNVPHMFGHLPVCFDAPICVVPSCFFFNFKYFIHFSKYSFEFCTIS